MFAKEALIDIVECKNLLIESDNSVYDCCNSILDTVGLCDVEYEYTPFGVFGYQVNGHILIRLRCGKLYCNVCVCGDFDHLAIASLLTKCFGGYIHKITIVDRE